MAETGQVGDFIGGIVGTIFSLGGFLILILTLSEQIKFANKERFESKFFDLLKIHRENIQEMSSKSKSGRKELTDIFSQFLKCKEETMFFFKRKKENHIYQNDYLMKLKKSFELTNNNVDVVTLAKLNIPYIIVFYGLSAEGKETIKAQFKKKYHPEFYEPILDFLAMKPIKESQHHKKWKSINTIADKRNKKRAFEIIRMLRNNPNHNEEDYPNISEKAKRNFYPNNYIKYYGGHQYKLGHYFRHLFQTFTFINEQKNLSNEEKYFYAKTLRAQLSTSEQLLLFINSLSHLGIVWDLSPRVSKKTIDFCYTKRLNNKRLITKYNLVKNLPSESIFGIKYKEFYPNINYEIEEE
ncbi:MAG: putative phage abortive infection protein [Weeksellaceae bacterium]|nr:putative phage abortive infection protein [Weeksellaceae bacterium]